MNGLTVNLHLMMVSFYRPTPERHKILIEGNAFPSDRYAMQSQLAWHGFDPESGLLEVCPRPGEDLVRTEDIEQLLDAEGHQIALVMLGAVNYYSGQWFDIPAVTAAARRRGCVVGLDLAHAIGNVPLLLHHWDVDFAVWCSYKYLNGGPGCVGGCFVHERHTHDPSVSRFAGWWGNDPVTRFQMHVQRDFVPQRTADGWQLSNPPILSMAALRPSLDLFAQAGILSLREKSVLLTGYLEFLLQRTIPHPPAIISPTDPAFRGCQLSIRLPQQGRAFFDAMSARDVVADFREPDVVRVAPVPFYNTFHEVWRFSQIVGNALATV